MEFCDCFNALSKIFTSIELDAIHDTVHEMARDEARYGKALEGLLERYFKQEEARYLPTRI